MKLLLTDKVDERELLPLAEFFTIDKKIGITEKELIKLIRKYDAVITRSSTAVSKNVLQNAKKLRIVGRAGIGVDNIDIFEATKRKIAVLNAPLGNSRVTAEHTIGLLFSLLRHIPQASQELKNGIWAKSKYTGYQIMGKTLGIVGFGNVGKWVYEIAVAVGLKVIVCEPYITLPDNVRKVTFEELLKESDIVSFHVPATYLTNKMLNKNTLLLCKNGVYIINCSRGKVIAEEAIINGLRTGKIAGFAVDVFTKEPNVNTELMSYANVIATPHIAGSTYESQKQSIQEVVKGIIDFVNGIPPSNLLNPQVFRKSDKTISKKPIEFDAVIFDMDSTLSEIEGNDLLGKWLGMEKEIAKLTNAGMNGELPYEEVFDKRLEIVKPSIGVLSKLGNHYIQNLVEDAKAVVNALKYIGINVYIVSGGYTQSLIEAGRGLGITSKYIFGNDLLHDKKGNYQSYVGGPLRRNHGKLQIVRQIPGKKIVIGDAITDLETKEYIDLFIGYGGVVKRKYVEERSDVYLFHKSLVPVLVIASGYNRTLKLLDTKYKKYIGKGLDILFHPKHVKVNKRWKKQFAEFNKLAYY